MILAGDRAAATRSARNPLPPKIAALLRETYWFGLLAAAALLFLILYTYDKADPGWSHSATDAVTRNAGGAFWRGRCQHCQMRDVYVGRGTAGTPLIHLVGATNVEIEFQGDDRYSAANRLETLYGSVTSGFQ